MTLPLQLQINPEGYGYYLERKRDPKFHKFEQKIFSRDEDACQYCSFQAQSHMTVVNIDGEYGPGHHKAENMATACPLCVQCLFLQEAGEQGNFGGGVLIKTPMPQAHLNAHCHVWFCAVLNHTSYAVAAQRKYHNAYETSDLLERSWGSGWSDPQTLTLNLRLWGDFDADEQKKFLKNLRLLPELHTHKDMIRDWAKEALSELEDEEEELMTSSKSSQS